MNCTQITLDRPAVLLFGDGKRITLHYVPEVGRGSARLHNGQPRVIPLVVDDGQTVQPARIHVISGEPRDQLLLVGGPTAAWVTSAGEVASTRALRRDVRADEYWSTQFQFVSAGLLAVLETEVLLIDAGLRIRWQIPKYLNDVIEEIADDRVGFVRDGAERWYVALTDGTLLSG
jgi:hypothetical protein